MSSELLKTGISKAFWCDYSSNKSCNIKCNEADRIFCSNRSGIASFSPAKIRIGEKGDHAEISWFDELFDGGIKLPASGSPLTMLISGPPGSGKTTLAMELCHRIAQNSTIQRGELLMPLYISADTESESLIKNADEFGWGFKNVILFSPDNQKEIERQIAERRELINDEKVCPIIIWGKENIENWGESNEIILAAIQSIGRIGEAFAQIVNRVNQSVGIRNIVSPLKNSSPSLMVIDSLNIIDNAEKRAEYFTQFISQISRNNKHLKLLIIVLDSSNAVGDHSFWDYVVDVVIQLEAHDTQRYYSRYLEIVKTRFQNHTLGKQFFKILPKYKKLDRSQISNCDYNIISQRNHPYRNEGGIFIYPSIHYYLSKYRKRTTPTAIGQAMKMPWPIGKMFRIPVGRCSAFIGPRGTHKSHLAYTLLMYNIVSDQTRGLIVSLREDEKKTRETINSINQHLRYQMDEKYKKDQKDKKYEERYNPNINNYISENRLEILHFLPGYITPNEFFHRLFISVHRMKQEIGDARKLIVVFNSLDEIGPRYPLCAKEEMFISGIIEFLTGEGVSSIFIAVKDDKHNVESYGLLPMSDLILSFEKEIYELEMYKEMIQKDPKIIEYFDEEKFHDSNASGHEKNKEGQETTVEVTKYSGGHKTGDKGILELVENTESSFFKERGLYLTPIISDR